MNVKIEENILIINNNKVKFEAPISTFLEINDILIVHLYIGKFNPSHFDLKGQPLNNVYAVNSEGEIEWNIKDILKTEFMRTGCEYDLLIIGYDYKDGILRMRDAEGIDYFIDAQKGLLLRKYGNK